MKVEEFVEHCNAMLTWPEARLERIDIERVISIIERQRAALVRLRDCDWVISLPERMDAVREIAREVLDQEV